MLEAEVRSGASESTTPARLGAIAGVVHPLRGVDPQAVAEGVTTVLGGRRLPFRPEANADPFQVLAQLASEWASDTPGAPSPAHGSWLLLTTELAAHHGPGADWCAALAAFRRPLLLVADPQAGWEGQARAHGAMARQGGIPLLGVVSHGELRAHHFAPALGLGLPWLGCLPAGGASTAQAWQEQLWRLREQLWFRWWQLCRTEQVMPCPCPQGNLTGKRGGAPAARSTTPQRASADSYRTDPGYRHGRG
ncbi:MAG: hypothetical protein F4218_04870 [Synechococcus sp. SB0677_bin_5]|nr:hypothetical protein [Synechococcus sp. SB0677_bin_5]MYG64315.1 hypothetical protein [Synechococcus sp. SB0675_bin_7]